MGTLKVPTKKLPDGIQLLIRDMREGMGKYTLAELVAAEKANVPNGETPYRRPGLPTDDGFSYTTFTNLVDAYKAQKSRKRYVPKEVQIEFEPGFNVEVNVASFSFNAVNGQEVSRDAETRTRLDDAHEPHYERWVKFHGPVVTHYGYSRRDARVVVSIPTGLSDEHDKSEPDSIWVPSPHHRAVEKYAKLIAAGDFNILNVLCVAAFEGVAFPVETEHAAREEALREREEYKAKQKEQRP